MSIFGKGPVPPRESKIEQTVRRAKADAARDKEAEKTSARTSRERAAANTTQPDNDPRKGR